MPLFATLIMRLPVTTLKLPPTADPGVFSLNPACRVTPLFTLSSTLAAMVQLLPWQKMASLPQLRVELPVMAKRLVNVPGTVVDSPSATRVCPWSPSPIPVRSPFQSHPENVPLVQPWSSAAAPELDLNRQPQT